MNTRHALTLALLAGATTMAQAGEVFNQGFETDTAGWIGTATRTSAGSSSSGSYHAVVTSNDHTKFGGYSSNWGGGFTASAAIYLDTNWAANEGFDYSVAISKNNGDHLRDFIFHVTENAAGDGLLIGANNNGNNDSSPIDNTNIDAPNSVFHTSDTILDSGWYTFEHRFYDFGDGTLAVDLNLINSSDDTVYTKTIHSGDIISGVGANVGGNRYGWFNALSVAGGISLDDVTLSTVPLPPAAFAGLGMLAGCAGIRSIRRRR